MKVKNISIISFSIISLLVGGCNYNKSGNENEANVVNKQTDIYAKGQPIPLFDFSLPRELLIELNRQKNKAFITTSIWYSFTGEIIGYCSSIGYGIPITTSLTNPQTIERKRYFGGHYAEGVIAQAEPDGTYIANNSDATWVFCTNPDGSISPRLIEQQVNTYPFAASVNKKTGEITPIGEPTYTIDIKKIKDENGL